MRMNSAIKRWLSCQVRPLTRLPSRTQPSLTKVPPENVTSMAHLATVATRLPRITSAAAMVAAAASISAVLVRAPNHTWWGGTSPLDEIHYIDFGTDPSAMLALAGSDEIDCNYETTGDFIEQLDAIGWKKQEAVTMSTIVVRMNSASELYKDKAVRQAIQKAVDPGDTLVADRIRLA